MNYPLISEYIEAIKAAEENFEELKHLRPILGDDGEPVMSSGNFAVVFKMMDEQTGKLHAVKCFLKEQEGRAKAYRLIAEELEYVSSTFLTPIKYLDKELFVDTAQTTETEFPVLLMDWVEGQTLDSHLRNLIWKYQNAESEQNAAECLGYMYELDLLAYQFSRLAMWLLPQPFAHGDLKPDNILVKDDGTLVLVDYDGMYVPAMKGQKARELGSPDFRHPSRTEDDFDEHIDDFSLVSILLSLKAIALQPELLEQYGASDRLLFSERDYRNLSESQVMDAIKTMMQDTELATLYSLFILSSAQNNLSQASFRLLNLKRPQQPKSLRVLNISKPIVNPRKEIIPFFHGKENVLHIVSPNGTASYITQGRCFADEAYAIGACKLNTVENDKKHVLFLFNSDDKEVGRYYIGKKIQGKSPDDLVKMKDRLAFFESWNPETKQWVPCVGLGADNNISQERETLRTNVTDDDLANSWVDNYGARYSEDWKRLLKGPSSEVVKTMVINNQNFKKTDMWVSGPIISDETGRTSYWCSFDSFENGVLIYLVSEVWKDLAEVNIDTLWDEFSKGNYIIREARDGETNEWLMDKNNQPVMKIVPMREMVHDSWDSEKLDLYFKELTEATDYFIKEGTIVICDQAFKNCNGLSSLSIPDGVISIGDSAFWHLNNLKSVVIPNSVTSIGKLAFYGCTGLTSLLISNKLKGIGDRAFGDCCNLKSLSIPSSVKEIGESCFQGCVKLISIVVDKKNRYYDSRNNCNAIVESNSNSLIVGCSSTIIPNTVTNIGDSAFFGCSDLKSAIIPNSVRKIGFAVFPGCDGLKTIIIPSNVGEMGNACFLDCKTLTDVEIHGHIHNIPYRTFYNCESLQCVSLPESVTEIGDEAFWGCKALKQITIPIGQRKKYEVLLPEYKDKLVEQEMGWTVKDSRLFNAEEIAMVLRAEVVRSDYGNSVCFFMRTGGQTYIPLSKQSKLTVGDELDIKTAKLITLSRKGKADITRVLE